MKNVIQFIMLCLLVKVLRLLLILLVQDVIQVIRFEDEERCEKEGEHGEEFKHIYEPCPATYDSCCICMKD